MNIFCLLAAAAISTVTVKPEEVRFPTAPSLWGIFFEDIDLSLDGGVYAELVRNRSFEDFNGAHDKLTLEYWNPVGNAEYALAKRPHGTKHNGHCCQVKGRAGAGIANEGYFGMAFRKGMTYDLEIDLASPDGVSEVTVALEGWSKPTLAEKTISGIGKDFKTFTASFSPNADEPQGRLVIRMKQGGELLVDCVSLFPRDAVCGLFRRDLVEKLAALKPSFMRFPGGCWVEGDRMADAYRWKQTLGSKWDRRTQWNIWQYWSTNSVGFHEYLLLAEYLKAEPLFCINVGMSHKENVPMDKMDEFVQDALDCISYCNDPVTTEWGARRAAAGHPEPFNLKYLEIGNENGGPEYEKRYALMANAVRARYPEVKLIFNNWSSTKKIADPKDLRDDHFYSTPDRAMGGLSREYDKKHGDFGIFVGEYGVIRGTTRYGSLRAAIGEAAFMCGLERNQDQVRLAAYAPLFAHAQHTVWTPNLIYPTTDGCFVNPSWNVQKIFGEKRGTHVLGLDINTETFETKTQEPWQRGTKTHEIRKVQGSAVVDAEGTIILKLVNVTDQPQTVKLNLAGQAKLTRFTGPHADAHNSPSNPHNLKETVEGVVVPQTPFDLPPYSLSVWEFRKDR